MAYGASGEYITGGNPGSVWLGGWGMCLDGTVCRGEGIAREGAVSGRGGRFIVCWHTIASFRRYRVMVMQVLVSE
jgi:hypothetical protein